MNPTPAVPLRTRPPAEFGYCTSSGKRCYSDHHAVLESNRDLNGSPRAYLCACGYWHLTRGASGEQRSIGDRAHIAGLPDGCADCGGTLEVRGMLCLSCCDPRRLGTDT